MMTITLESLRCIETGAVYDTDQCSMKVSADADEEMIMQHDMSDGQLWAIDCSLGFETLVHIEIWELDLAIANALNPHFKLGEFVVLAGIPGEHSLEFQNGGAAYELKYRVDRVDNYSRFTN